MPQKKFFLPPTDAKEYGDYLLQKYAGVAPKIPNTWKKIPFARNPTYITPEGEAYSHTTHFPLKKLSISKWGKGEPCVSVRLDKNKYKKSHQLGLIRLFFFCFVYPGIINKKLEDMNLLDFIRMPQVTLRDEDYSNIQLSNFVFIGTHTDTILHLYKKTRPEYRKYFKFHSSPKSPIKK